VAFGNGSPLKGFTVGVTLSMVNILFYKNYKSGMVVHID
tara:strand:- start:158249 stop:158365 length:117 start_codon:yes stop_codon:yes gene_type:complete